MSDIFPIRGVQKHRGAYLPHWTRAGGSYFVTFRMTGSLPASLQKEIECLRADISGIALQDGRSLTDSELEAMEELHFRELDVLERNKGNRLLENDQAAEIVAKALRHFDGERYRLFAWAIMPNHVHVVFDPIGKWQLTQILHSWKSFTANAANGDGRLRPTHCSANGSPPTHWLEAQCHSLFVATNLAAWHRSYFLIRAIHLFFTKGIETVERRYPAVGISAFSQGSGKPIE